ncbi:MAG: hypothetical protein JO144_11500 [Actinobacteria bacterium]|nr:hypothetical protein [Actinomycetota bacterium]
MSYLIAGDNGHNAGMPDDDDLAEVLPIVTADSQAMWAQHFPDGTPTPLTPLGAALLWWQALSDPVEYRNALENLSLNPGAWGDYSEAADHISHLSILTEPIRVQDEPDGIAGIKFIEFGGEAVGQVFEEAELHDVWIVTVVKPTGQDWWRVWGLSHNHQPTADEVYGH